MKAVQLSSFADLEGLKLVEIDRPTPSKNEILIQVKAAGINFAELEMIGGRYPAPMTTRAELRRVRRNRLALQ